MDLLVGFPMHRRKLWMAALAIFVLPACGDLEESIPGSCKAAQDQLIVSDTGMSAMDWRVIKVAGSSKDSIKGERPSGTAYFRITNIHHDNGSEMVTTNRRSEGCFTFPSGDWTFDFDWERRISGDGTVAEVPVIFIYTDRFTPYFHKTWETIPTSLTTFGSAYQFKNLTLDKFADDKGNIPNLRRINIKVFFGYAVKTTTTKASGSKMKHDLQRFRVIANKK